jgi:succinoglycan biosynthesis protein ExoM
MRIAVCICTRQRPVMLDRCLSAVAAMRPPQGAEAGIFVIGNEVREESRPIAEKHGAAYVCEPQLGIPFARNAAVEAALAWEADFVAFLDDDTWPEPDWLEKIVLTQKLTGATAVRGLRVMVYPDPLPAWILKRRSKGMGRRAVVPINEGGAGCNNLLIDASVFRKGLRFDPRYRFSTGEDTMLAAKIVEQGGTLIATDFAVIHEEVVAERCTLQAQVMQQYAFGIGNIRILKDRGKYALSLWAALVSGFQALLALSAAAIFGMLSLSKRRFKRHFLRAGKKAAYAAGVIASLCGRTYEPYRTIAGY